MHFKELEYTRPDADAACARIAECARRIAEAPSTRERLTALAEYETYDAELSTALALGQLRYYLDTLDPARATEMAYIGENVPKLQTCASEISEALLNAPRPRGT